MLARRAVTLKLYWLAAVAVLSVRGSRERQEFVAHEGHTAHHSPPSLLSFAAASKTVSDRRSCSKNAKLVSVGVCARSRSPYC